MTAPNAQSASLQLLLVEDDLPLADGLSSALEHAGYRVLGPFHTSAAAIGAMEHGKPDIALVNSRLANGEDGLELARMLRHLWGVPTLLTSGEMADGLDARDAAVGYLGRPFTIPAAVDCVTALGAWLAGTPVVAPSGCHFFRRLNTAATAPAAAD
jgi:DNA-binding response OmpR family regulator